MCFRDCLQTEVVSSMVFRAPAYSLRAVAVHLGPSPRKRWADAPRGAPTRVKTKPLVPAVSETPRLGIMFVVYQSDAKVVKCVFSMLKSGDKIKLNIVFVFTRVQKPMVLMPWLSG